LITYSLNVTKKQEIKLKITLTTTKIIITSGIFLLHLPVLIKLK